ncbi:hypothetical protein PS691_05780 [Pseudomonas fluorescens]|uniref:Uncharacterized protein n=1 Tax=Pseudomonas fluorescens TaxID=294 RepID=A0A5E7FRT9_PSEFL|nr:hypothetical protein PS691_05780 [Pseudomonas fluorescens]
MPIRQVRPGLAAGQGGGADGEAEHAVDLFATQALQALHRIQLLFGQPGDQCRLEGVAGAHGIGHHHGTGRHRPGAMAAAEHGRALAATGQEYQLAAVFQPAFDHALRIALGVEQGQVFVTDLDQVGMLDQSTDAFAPPFDIRLRVESHVGVEADQAFTAFAADQGQQGVGNRLHHQRERADMQPAHLSAQLRQMPRQQLAIGAAFAAETVMRRAIGADGDHGQGGRCIEFLQVVRAHAFLLQHLL